MGGRRLSEPRRSKLAEQIDEMCSQFFRDNDNKKVANMCVPYENVFCQGYFQDKAEKVNTDARVKAIEFYNEQMEKVGILTASGEMQWNRVSSIVLQEYGDGQETPVQTDLESCDKRHRQSAGELFEALLSPTGGQELSDKYRDELLDEFAKAFARHAQRAGDKKVSVDVVSPTVS